MERKGTPPERGSGEAAPMVAGGMTHTGKRTRNEDYHVIREDLGLAVVADGFSGAHGGDRASRLAVEEIVRRIDTQEEQTMPELGSDEAEDDLAIAIMRYAIHQAHKHVSHVARHSGPPLMCAAVGALVVAGPRVILGYSGCVQVYRFRSDQLEPLTVDRPLSYPIGARTGVKLTVRGDTWQPGDLYLLCTSGLHRVLAAEAIRCTLASCPELAGIAPSLVGRAVHAGGADNMTAVVVRPVPAPTTGDGGAANGPDRDAGGSCRLT